MIFPFLVALWLAAAPAGPDPAAAARAWMAAPPATLAERLEREPALVPQALGALGQALGAADPADHTNQILRRDAGEYLVQCARARSAALARRGTWSPADVQALLTLDLVIPGRFIADAAFRARVLALLPREFDPTVDLTAGPRLRDDLLLALNRIEGIDFAASEAIESAWGAVPRQSAARRVDYAPGLRFDDEAERPLSASVYSLPSAFFDVAAAESFLAAVRQAAPKRTILVLTDLPLHRALESRARSLGVHLLETYGRAYSPWPRDPFSLVRTPAGGVLVLVRPNLQTGREEDAHLGPELVQNLPDEIDRAWGKATWTEAPVPFHNGQILLTQDAAWITLHTLEPRILARLGLARVPVDTFGTTEGLDRYVAAAHTAAEEMSHLYGRPVRFVHPLPEPGAPLAERSAMMRTLGGGAGYDLDSLVTFLPGTTSPIALVADLAAGRKLLAQTSAADRTALRTGYDLEPDGEALTAALAAAQETPRAAALAAFLDLTAGHLAANGVRVLRLPLVRIPYALLRDKAGLPDGATANDREFLLTWNNVVVETRDGHLRAEGFGSLLPSGDAAARAVFTRAGARLDLFPPLVRSIVLNGGYRCASNHVRTCSKSSGG
ncbi:MAG TPA: hypothetical protein VH988_18290 [Thermoanaerobaculia bacterium]|jgi:hypothetical protein|nr:hypothetical protein [Thermoanaerobaculia bacterium]